MTKPRASFIAPIILGATSFVGFALLSAYYSDSLTSINSSDWNQNGTVTATSAGLTSTNSNGGSIISKVSVPDGSSSYDVWTELNLPQSGGNYVIYLRASTNALSGPAAAGTAYAIELQNPTFNGSACSATLAAYKIVSGTVTPLGSTGVICENPMSLRAIYTKVANQIAVYINGVEMLDITDASITTGMPGLGVRGAPTSNTISYVQLLPIYPGAPTMPPTDEIGVSPFSNKVEIQWPGASEPSGPGAIQYQIYRNGTLLATASEYKKYVDLSVSPSTSYSYSIYALDYDLNQSGPDTFSVTTPPTGAIDPRQVGVRPTGSYWGAAGEQIDMRSGNLNYTLPMIKAMGRGGWSVNLNLTYNSQNWRQDPGGTWLLGEDIGYGYGWKLLAGSLLAFNTPTGVGEYVFTDATGAQYHLNQNNAGIWTSLESIYVSFDSNANELHFNDGSFWVMGCTSAIGEWDAGTMYPTLMEDSNGNQVIITYNEAVGANWSNSSSRINTIEDVRGNGSHDYTFTYNTDAIPHLTKITNTIGTAENYSFTYTENYALNDPFAGQNFGTVALLASSTVTGIPLATYFSYDTASATNSCSSPGTGTSGPGQLSQVTMPYCGHLRWAYNSHSVSGTRNFYQVQYRYLSMSSGSAETSMQISRGNDNSYTVQQSGTLDDLSANARKIWNFQTSTTQFNLGLVTQYSERSLPSNTILSQLNYAWSQTPTSLNPYISSTTTHLDPGQTYEADKQTTQTLDQYGNLTQLQVFSFGAGTVGPLARTFSNSYLYTTDPNYASKYVFNRLVNSTVTDGTNSATLAQNCYDAETNNYYCGAAGLTSVTGQHEHDDANYGTSFLYRGNLSTSQTPTTAGFTDYDMDGNARITSVNGVESTVTQSNNYAAPSQITTGSLNSTMNWTSFLGLNSATGSNGDSGSINYDSNARPSQTTSPYGAVTTYAYSDTTIPPAKMATTDGHFVWSAMDGFGRTTATVTGYSVHGQPNTTISTVDTQYAPCGCSPLGKLSQQSQPYGPSGTDAWTVYHYDASGRTTSVVLPDGSSTTTYLYQGNTVTVTDPAGKWKTFTMDAFGNLVTVQEPDPTLLTTVTTSYTYDILNHLIVVSMPRGTTYGTQYRTFNYNTGTTVTGFLQSATNPENGTVTYTYNTPTNTLKSKTDAKGTLNYVYDGLNRLTSVSAGGTAPLRTYYYDSTPLSMDPTGTFSQNPLGRLTAVQYPAQGSASGPQMNDMYSYTQAGLPAAKRLQVNEALSWRDSQGYGHNATATNNLDSTYAYNSEGKLTAITYPTTTNDSFVNGFPTGPGTYPGPSYNYSYDSMYRLGGMTTSTGTTVVNNVSYNPANQLLTISYPSANETRGYNVLGQLTSLLDTQNPCCNTYENLTYIYPAGANNGKLTSMSNAISGETVTYTYDSLNRLLTANGSGWGEQYGFDPFGNLTTKQVTAGSGPSLSQSVNTATNRITGGSYDANGNTTSVFNNGFTYGLGYDVENRLVAASYSAGYLEYAYDAQNRRIWSWPGSTDIYGQGNPDGYLVSLYSPAGQKLGTYEISVYNTSLTGMTLTTLSTLKTSDQYFGGRRLAVMDQLGSVVENSGSQVQGYYPWGEPKGTVNPQDTWNFATYWADSFTGLDYANNRYYSNAYGRFMTPDPYTNSGRLNDPQSWNRYAYTRGDPVNRVDPNGTDDSPPYLCPVGAGEGTELVECFDVMVSIPSGFNPAAAAQAAAAFAVAQVANNIASMVLSNQYFYNVASLALQALGSPECAALYNTSGRGDFTPQMVLQSMIPGGSPSGYYFGTITFGSIAGAISAQTNIGGGVSGYGFTVADIEINAGPTGDFFNGDLVNSVDTLLHELGHVFGLLPALGGSSIVYDANKDGSPNAAAEAANEAALAPCRTATEALLK